LVEVGEIGGGSGDGAVERGEVPADDRDAVAHAILQGKGDADFVGFSHPGCLAG